jgi:hypothetical protein
MPKRRPSLICACIAVPFSSRGSGVSRSSPGLKLSRMLPLSVLPAHRRDLTRTHNVDSARLMVFNPTLSSLLRGQGKKSARYGRPGRTRRCARSALMGSFAPACRPWRRPQAPVVSAILRIFGAHSSHFETTVRAPSWWEATAPARCLRENVNDAGEKGLTGHSRVSRYKEDGGSAVCSL